MQPEHQVLLPHMQQSCPKACYCSHHSYWLWTNAKTFGENESFTLKYETRIVTLVTRVIVSSAYSVVVNLVNTIVKSGSQLKLASSYHLLVCAELLGI